ncbi:FIST N-terminal domain-containing protein [Mesorhizobium sp. LHD-90]|uniref:FIST N-terminal domain-containing protein n=1 Tax=Mesorhizobium sp. LHD-90 TaxID=3071414 RepID=UPI0027DF0CEF|nr:FIST N-terminal domain-containing protein [Mesorhizobium sp. LHD-90]MDQ6432924.1 FIST N-terminal domain-containing protein [Mesorhizobium sp. LHD-90]
MERVCSETSYGCGLTVVSTDKPDPTTFAREVAETAMETGAGFALFFFSQALVSAEELSDAIQRCAPGLRYAGCSTAGEITPVGIEEGQMLAVLFPAGSFTIASAIIPHLSSSGMEAIASQVGALRRSLTAHTGRLSSGNAFALCLIDGLSFAEESVAAAIHWGLDDIPLVGGSAGDDLRFEATTLISDGVVATDCAVVVLVATDVPFHVFKTENFVPTDEKLVVTASDPSRRVVHEFNAATASEEFAHAVGVMPDALTPLSFASHPVVVRVGGEYYCRSIQKLNSDGSLSFFCAIDDGIVLSIAEPTDMVESTRTALAAVGEKVGGIDVILGFDCVLRRLDARNRQVLRDISELYRSNNLVGFGTYGEQYRTMHLNQTLTGIAFGRRQAAE